MFIITTAANLGSCSISCTIALDTDAYEWAGGWTSNCILPADVRHAAAWHLQDVQELVHGVLDAADGVAPPDLEAHRPQRLRRLVPVRLRCMASLRSKCSQQGVLRAQSSAYRPVVHLGRCS